jgi:hypothetical protein
VPDTAGAPIDRKDSRGRLDRIVVRDDTELLDVVHVDPEGDFVLSGPGFVLLAARISVLIQHGPKLEPFSPKPFIVYHPSSIDEAPEYVGALAVKQGGRIELGIVRLDFGSFKNGRFGLSGLRLGRLESDGLGGIRLGACGFSRTWLSLNRCGLAGGAAANKSRYGKPG